MTLPMIPADKANHAVYGAVICAVVIVVLAVFGAIPGRRYAAGFLASVVAGVIKELIDMRGRGTPSGADILATIFGGFVVALSAVVGA